MDETHLTPEQVRERFGELTVPAGSNRVHAHFEGPDGAEWRPEFDQNMRLVGYRLFRFRKPGRQKVSFRP